MLAALQISFEYPYWLSLLAVLPAVWWVAWNSPTALGPVRWSLAVLLRTLVCLLIIAAIAGVQWVWTSDRTAVIYLLDQSDSIPAARREAMLQFAIESVARHRRSPREDMAGVIVFGRQAAIELPPIDDDLPPLQRPESVFGAPDATNIESAFELAAASFPEGARRRIVIVSDGNETIGAALPTAKTLTDTGVGIDVVPIELTDAAEVLIDKIDVPGNVRVSQPFESRVVIERYSEDNQPVQGRLEVSRAVGRSSEVIHDEVLTLERDVTVVSIADQLEQPAGYTYTAKFIPEDDTSDSVSMNNSASAFTFVKGKGRVLLIEDVSKAGEYEPFIEALRQSEIEVEVRDTGELYSSLIELQAYDAVVLAGTPRTSGESADGVSSFSDEQIKMLTASIDQFGIGCLMLGGENAFGSGGWANTELEAAMPVNFQIENRKVEAVGALAMVMHASEIASGNHWQKVIGKSALEALGPLDYCGIIHYDHLGGDRWLWGGSGGMLRVGPQRGAMLALISQMSPGDMPDFDPGLRMGYSGLAQTPASLKHMIVISDGDPSPPSGAVVQSFIGANIKVSTVAVGGHGPAGHDTLRRLARDTGGNYYVVSNSQALPKIFMREARRVSRSLLFENPNTPVRLESRHEVLIGINDNFPPVDGYVLTQLKESPLVQRPLRAALPGEEDVSTIFAIWNYGLGRAAVFTSDAGSRWADSWVAWPSYRQFNAQLVRYIMRPSVDDANYTVATNVRDGEIQVVVNATDAQDRSINFLQMNGAVLGPDLQPVPIVLEQQSPGRYIGRAAATQSGAYVVSVVPEAGKAPLTTGVTVPFSAEYRLKQTNRRLLESLASLTPVGGVAGKIADPLDEGRFDELLALDPYRGGIAETRSLQDVWPWAVFVGASLFLLDVGVRRIAIRPPSPTAWAQRKRQATEASVASAAARLDRLSRVKGQPTPAADEEHARNDGADQYQPGSVDGRGTTVSDFGQMESRLGKSADQKDSAVSPPEDAASHTERLLKAKRQRRSE